MSLIVGCSDDTPVSEGTEGTAGTAETGDGDGDNTETGTASGDGDGDPATGDGDGDTTTTGDGDGDTTTTGDGDGDTTTTGDGDGDQTGDGDGDGTGDGDGDGTGDGDGDGTGDGDGDGTGDGDGDGTGDGDGDGMGGDGDGDPPINLPAWILSIDEVDNTTDRLIRISIDDNDVGTVTEICDDIILPDDIPATTNITSLTFNANILFASAQDNAIGDTLLVIDPCTCEATEVGKYSGFTAVNGITSNETDEMFGVAVTQDVIIDIDPNDAVSVEVYDLMANWGSTGLTWSQPQDNVLYGINASTDRLHRFDGDTAEEIDSLQLMGNFGSVGLELHPTFDRLFGCGIAGDGNSLYEVNVETGEVSLVAADVWQANCDNIAAPWGPVECIPM